MKPTPKLAGIALILLASVSCQKFDQNDLVVSANLNLYKTIVNCTYTDAATGKPVTITAGSQLKVEVISEVRDLVMGISSGKFQTVFKSHYPFTSFALNPYSETPSFEKPIELLVKTTHPDYLDHYSTISILAEQVLNHEIRLISKTRIPEGMDVTTFSKVLMLDDTGVAGDSVDLVSGNGKFIFHISQGSILKDDKGQPLTGQISVEMISVDPTTEAGKQNVPGIKQPLLTGDGEVSALFNPITYSSVVISDERGQIAASVAGEPLVYISLVDTAWLSTVAKGLRPLKENFDLSVAVPGLPIFSFNPSNGMWTACGEGVFKPTPFGPGMGITRANTAIPVALTSSKDQDKPYDLRFDVDIDEARLPARIIVIGNLTVGGVSGKLSPTVVTIAKGSQFFTISRLDPKTEMIEICLDHSLFNQTFCKRIDKQTLDARVPVDIALPESLFRKLTINYTTNVYLEVKCFESNNNPLYLRSEDLPASFHLIMSGSKIENDTTIQVNYGFFELPFDPFDIQGGSWQAKVVMGEDEFPQGDARVTINRESLSRIHGRVSFTYTPGTSEGCQELKKFLIK